MTRAFAPPSKRQSPEAELLAVRLSLPYPPSTNNLFLNGARKARVKTPRYRAWLEEAGWGIKRQLPRVRTIDGPYALVLHFNMPRRGKIDVGNYEKAVSDLLVAAGVVADDSNAETITLHKLPEIIKGGRLELTVTPVADCGGMVA